MRWIRCLCCFAILFSPAVARAGGGPLNVLVIVNADDPEAVAVAEHYAEARSLPEGHVCGVTGIDSSERTISFADYESIVHPAVTSCLGALPQPDEVDYLVVVRGLPYRVDLPAGGYYTSFSAMLQVHEAANTGDGSPLMGRPQLHVTNFQASFRNPIYVDGVCQGGDLQVSNPYASWYSSACSIVRRNEHPASFRRADAGSAGGYDFQDNLFVVTRLDGFDYDDAHDLVDRGVVADGTFPGAEILCMASSDEPRGARDPECEFTARHLTLAGFNGAWVTPFDSALSGHTVAAYFTGTAGLRNAIADNTYVEGAITCNLTSFGARPQNFFCDTTGTQCPASESQTSIARFVRAGTTGAHGTVAEPLNNCFPNAGTLLFYTFGYNLGESYFFNQQFLYWVNLVLGDPLTTPYGERPVVGLSHEGQVEHGTTVQVTATHPNGIAALRLYVDGTLEAEETTSPLGWVVDLAEGTDASLLAVAVAENATVSRTGWPEESHLARPDVQGWRVVSIHVTGQGTGDAGPGSDGGAGRDATVSSDASPTDDDGKKGCGCATTQGGPSVLLILFLLLALVRIYRAR